MIDHNLVLWDSGEGEEIATKIAIAGDFLPAGNLAFPAGVGWSQMAAHVAAYFRDVATTFVNLECAILDGTLAPRPLTGIGQTVRAHRESLEYLGPIHAEAIGMANNHSYDFSDAGVTQTREAISTHGMSPLGAGRTTRESPEVYVWQGPNELRIGFWAAAKASHDIATDDTPGVEPATTKRALQAVKEMKRRGAAFCVALLHVGVLRTNRPDPEDVRLVDSLAKSGFHVVACSHSHRVAGYKRIQSVQNLPSFSFYGLGSLVSGYIASPLEREGLIAVAGFNRHGKFTRMEIRPVFLDDSGFGTIPNAAMSHTILARFQKLSEEIADGSYEKLFYRDVSAGLFRIYMRDVRAALRHRGVRGLAAKMSRMRFRHVRRLVRKVTG